MEKPEYKDRSTSLTLLINQGYIKNYGTASNTIRDETGPFLPALFSYISQLLSAID